MLLGGLNFVVGGLLKILHIFVIERRSVDQDRSWKSAAPLEQLQLAEMAFNARGSFYRVQTDRSDDANAAAAADDEGRANSAAVRKKSSRSAKPYARRAA